MTKSTDSYSKEINFNKVLFLHINRIAQSISNTNLYMGFIEILNVLLLPYQDEKYKEDLKKNTAISSAIASMDGMCKNKSDMKRQNDINNATHKFGALMCLAERKGLLLAKTGYGYDDDEDDENDTKL